ncbi:MAG: phosphoribosyltransferase family protein, partial [Candidatus Pacebacteria bacterium]|nr:phosphoribosyltransferase family protein [Candidatus Paceibacterota bacterium]
KKRRKKRGYNQCELLAAFFIREMSVRGAQDRFTIRTDILEKPIDTQKLAFQNRVARLQANKGVFRVSCNLSHFQGRIIIIDDVITTGSTMRSAMGALETAGAKNITGIGIAH